MYSECKTLLILICLMVFLASVAVSTLAMFAFYPSISYPLPPTTNITLYYLHRLFCSLLQSCNSILCFTHLVLIPHALPISGISSLQTVWSFSPTSCSCSLIYCSADLLCLLHPRQFALLFSPPLTLCTPHQPCMPLCSFLHQTLHLQVLLDPPIPCTCTLSCLQLHHLRSTNICLSMHDVFLMQSLCTLSFP